MVTPAGDYEMLDRIAEASPRPRARITGAVYLLYFLMAVLGELFMKGFVVSDDAAATATNIRVHQLLFRLGLATGLVAPACYVAATALFYALFKPVNRSLSVVAAFFGLVGCTIQAFGSLFQLAPKVVLGGSQYLSAFQCGTVAGPGADVLQIECSDLQYLPGILRILLPPDRVSHLQVDLPAANTGRTDDVGRSGLVDLSVTAAGKLSVALHFGRRLHRGIIALPVAPGDGRERSTMDGDGRRSVNGAV
jgi:hypothetical protein